VPALESDALAGTALTMNEPTVLRLGAAHGALVRALADLLAVYGLHLRHLDAGDIPGSYWGDSEAGLRGAALFVRADTPLHSALHEACHYICADEARRAALDTDAGGDVLEECAVCYLSIVLARRLPGASQAQMFADMDAWGYSFRLGSARAWFDTEADDARDWLCEHGVLDASAHPTGRCAAGHHAPATASLDRAPPAAGARQFDEGR
jgi:hypothetical protein